MIELKSYLQDAWVTGSGQPTRLLNPATEEEVASVCSEGLDLSGAFRYAREVGGPALRAMTYAERGDLLRAMSKALHEAREDLMAASIVNAGTTRSDAKFDIDGATGTLAYYAGLGQEIGARRYLREGQGEALTRSARFFGFHIKTPRRGVAVHINAFNFPAWGFAEKAAVALLSGVPVISKPGTPTALLAFRCMEVLVHAEILPAGAIALLCGGARDLLEHVQGQDMLAFTGGGSTGNHLRRLERVVEQSVRVNVEADSLNAAVLCPEVEPGSDTYQMFLRDVVKEMTQKSGQKCTGIRRIFVPASQVERVQGDLGDELGRIKIGNPANEDVRMGPLASAQQLEAVRAGVQLLMDDGAYVVVGDPKEREHDNPHDGKGFFFAPVVLQHDHPAEAGAVHEHEVFGPVATLMPYDAVEDVAPWVALAQGGLVAAIYGDDKAVLAELMLELAPYHGRILVGTRKVAGQAISPGMVLPSCVHGGPGRAGGGEELGGLRGLDFYHQRTAMQGDRALLDRIFG